MIYVIRGPASDILDISPTERIPCISHPHRGAIAACLRYFTDRASRDVNPVCMYISNILEIQHNIVTYTCQAVTLASTKVTLPVARSINGRLSLSGSR